ncbi:hypothetical protein PHET_04390 [Paragonimus heterotremus]|uniref:Uncharacterized protein n=1 Tax=Paragonimus heterotremus TaxID=100268 RepID=A0A8J4X0K0_9TREM|nr:hypothetical protein PHET_04390 [Paragonimus heterotremus]
MFTFGEVFLVVAFGLFCVQGSGHFIDSGYFEGKFDHSHRAFIRDKTGESCETYCYRPRKNWKLEEECRNRCRSTGHSSDACADMCVCIIKGSRQLAGLHNNFGFSRRRDTPVVVTQRSDDC